MQVKFDQSGFVLLGREWTVCSKIICMICDYISAFRFANVLARNFSKAAPSSIFFTSDIVKAD